jgi:hypothetical protein
MDTNLNITPTADMPPVTTTTSGSTTGTTASGITPSDEARLASSLEQEALKSQAGFTAAQGEQIPIVEEQKAAGTDAQATALEAQALEAQRVRDNYLQRISYAQTQSDRARQRYESFQFHNYWDSLTTGQQVQSRIAAFMGGFVQGVNGGQNVALQSLMSAADRDFEQQKAQLGKSERSAEWASKGVTDLYGQMQHDLAALEVKHGLALKAVAAKAQSALIRAGIPAAEAANDATVQGLMAGSYAKDLAAKQRYEQHYDRQQTQKAESQTTAAKGGKPEHGDVKEVADADDALRNIDSMIDQIKKDPAAWKEYRDNNESWQRAEAAKGSHLINPIRTIGQISGFANVAPEQGLTTDSARTLHQRQEKLNTGIAKGFGGVITEGDRAAAASQQGNLSLDPAQKIKQLKELRDSVEAKRNEYISNRGVKPGYSPPGAGAAVAPKLSKDQIKDKLRRTNQYIHDNPGAPDVAEARRSVADLHVQLGQ